MRWPDARRRRAVLYRRRDDEWFQLAACEIELPDGPVSLHVELDADGIRATAPEIDAYFRATDTMFRAGKAGFRTLGESVLLDLKVTAHPWQARRNAIRAAQQRAAYTERSRPVPDAVLRDSIDLEQLGGTPVFSDFAARGRFDMLITEEECLRALDASGEEMWRVDEPIRNPVLSRTHDGTDGRLIYALSGSRKVVSRSNVSGGVSDTIVQNEMVVLRGSDGQVLARAELPPEEGDMRFFDWAPGSGAQGRDRIPVSRRQWTTRTAARTATHRPSTHRVRRRARRAA